MANLFKLTRDVRGNWRRQNLGVKANGVKATFSLGKKYDDACKRVVLLEQMWAAIESRCGRWEEDTYAIALAVSRGESPVYVRSPHARLIDLCELFPFLNLKGESVPMIRFSVTIEGDSFIPCRALMEALTAGYLLSPERIVWEEQADPARIVIFIDTFDEKTFKAFDKVKLWMVNRYGG